MMVLRFFISIVLLLVSSLLQASYLISEDHDLTHISLGPKINFLVEDSPSVNLENLRQNAEQFDWQTTSDITPNFGFNVPPHWFLVDLTNESVSDVSWLLQIQYPLLDSVDVYFFKDDGTTEQWHTGDRVEFYKRPFDHRQFLFPLELESLQDARLIFRVASSGSMQVPMNLWDEKEFYRTEQSRSIPNGIFIGLFLVLIIYNFFLYISTLDRSYLNYVVFASGFMFFFMALSGYGFQYIWGDYPAFQQLSVFSFVCITNIGMAEFTIRFLHIKAKNVIIYKMLKAVTWVTAMCALLMFFVPYKFMIQALMFSCLYTAIISTMVGYRKISTMGIAASFYAAGWIIMAIGVIVLVLNKFAVLEANIFTEFASPVSVTIFSLLLSFALGIRIQEERKNLLVAENNALISQKEALQARLKASKMEFKNKQIKVNAEAESQSKNAFLAMMSHEIRTPLNGIMGLSDLLKTSDLDNKQKQYAETIYSSGESLLTIINDILDFSKILAGKLDVESITVNAFDLVNNCTAIFSNELEEKGINLFITVSPPMPFLIKSDPVRLRQVILNYLSNAIKFTNKGDIHLDLSLHKETDILKLEVQDEGIGIPKEKQASLFDAFSQADSTTTRKYGGTGLGLAICKQLSQLMGGHVGVSSAPGVGSKFWFECKVKILDRSLLSTPIKLNKHYLSVLDDQSEFDYINSQLSQWGCSLTPITNEKPDIQYDGLFIEQKSAYNYSNKELLANHSLRRESVYTIGSFKEDAILSRPLTTCALFGIVHNDSNKARQKEPVKIKNRDPEINQPSPLNGLHILVAEDNQVNQVVIKAVLKKLGAEFTLVENGALALEQMKNQPGDYDLVLMDCEMPIMDGFTAAEGIRALPSDQTIRTPIIALTAHAMEVHKKRAKSSGMDGFVTKPLKPEILVKAIQKSISGNI